MGAPEEEKESTEDFDEEEDDPEVGKGQGTRYRAVAARANYLSRRHVDGGLEARGATTYVG